MAPVVVVMSSDLPLTVSRNEYRKIVVVGGFTEKVFMLLLVSSVRSTSQRWNCHAMQERHNYGCTQSSTSGIRDQDGQYMVIVHFHKRNGKLIVAFTPQYCMHL